MSSRTPTSRIAENLPTGPRGRRFLLEYALASELARNPVRTEGTFGHAAVHTAHRLAPGRMSTSELLGWNTSDEQPSGVNSAEVVEHLNALELLEPTPELLRRALATAVGNARYWQAPDGEDLLAATPEMQIALERVAEHVAASPLTAWWSTPVAISAQQSVKWEDAPPKSFPWRCSCSPTCGP